MKSNIFLLCIYVINFKVHMWQKSNAPFVSNLNIIPRILGVTSGLSAQRQSLLFSQTQYRNPWKKRRKKSSFGIVNGARYDDGRKKYARSTYTHWGGECTKSKNSITVWKLGGDERGMSAFSCSNANKEARWQNLHNLNACLPGNTRTSNIAEFPQAADHVIRRNLKFPTRRARFIRDLCWNKLAKYIHVLCESWEYIFIANKIMNVQDEFRFWKYYSN